MKKLNAKQRREGIKELVEKENQVNVVELAELYRTSQATIRTDLNEMDHANLLHRTHGGAVSISTAYRSCYAGTLIERMNTNKEEKMRIAKAGASLVQNGDTIIIACGTTCVYLARELALKDNITVLTNGLLIVQELIYNPTIKVILFGGDVEFSDQFTHGNETITQLHKYKATKYLLSMDGISVEHGITTFHHQEAEISRLLMGRAREVIGLADHSKIDKEGFSAVAPITGIDKLITDKYVPNDFDLSVLRTKGIEIIEV